MTALAPFAVANSAPGNGSNFLALAYEIGAIMLVLGKPNLQHFYAFIN